MPSKSKAQQKFMGMVHALKKGELKYPSPDVKKASKSMSKKSAEDYASTKHKGKPEHTKKESFMKISKSKLVNMIEEEILKSLINEDPRGTYGFETGIAGLQGSEGEDANIDLYRKAVKALNLWVAEKGRPSQRVWRGGHPKSFESVAKKLYPDEYKYVMAKAWTIPVREIPYYYGQIAGQQKDKQGGGYKGAETTGKEKGWQGQKGSGIACKGVK